MPSKSVARAYPTGRTTPRKGASPAAGPGSVKKSMLAFVSQDKWDVNHSRSIQSGWIWRGFLMLTLFAVGAAIIFLGNHLDTLAILWFVIAAGWFATAMWLWRKHSSWVKGDLE